MTKEEFAAALRSIANHILSVAATFDPATPTERYLVTEAGERLRISEVTANYLVVEPAPVEPPA